MYIKIYNFLFCYIITFIFLIIIEKCLSVNLKENFENNKDMLT